MKKTYLYWIHYPHHRDPMTEGYIGVSYDPEKRVKYHRRGDGGDNPKLKNALDKGALVTILLEFDDRNEALIAEEGYRPDKNMGWNIIKGGTDTPSVSGMTFDSPNHGMRNKKHKAETKKLMSKQRVGKLWFNNGKINRRAYTCPEGFTSGRLPFEQHLSDEGRSKLGKSGRPIITPYGAFNTITEAGQKLNMTQDKVRWRVTKDKFPDWYYDT